MKVVVEGTRNLYTAGFLIKFILATTIKLEFNCNSSGKLHVQELIIVTNISFYSIFHFLITWLSYLFILSYLVMVTVMGHTDPWTYHLIYHLIKSHDQSHAWQHLMQTNYPSSYNNSFLLHPLWDYSYPCPLPYASILTFIIKWDIHSLNPFRISHSHMVAPFSHSLFHSFLLARLLPIPHH
jgi:hypothetical protein